MMDEISSITARISQIQQRIASLSQPDAQTPTAPEAPTFAKTLSAVQAGGPTTLPSGPAGVAVPAASLGPLPVLPVAPGASDVVPISTASSGDYETLIQKYAVQNNLEPSLVKAVIQTESGGNPRSVSSAGAMGLMQLMPDNVKEAGISDPFDPEQNIAAGTKQLSGLLTQYHGDVDLALAGYNAGPGNVRKYGGVPPFTETQNYIHRVRAAMGK
ncbi:MAG: lytic transglycosylase domain-containing protein [Janthinobacterium lividum]